MTEEDARAEIAKNVSRETMAQLEAYAGALTKWQKAINLVARGSIPELWSRHFLDSAQVFDLCPVTDGLWVDLGSGAGFPGLVCAVIAAEKAPGLSFTMIESDLRKATFLRTVASQLNLHVNVLSQRIEDAAPQNAQVVSARALAPLDKLCGLAARHLAPEGIALFQKGATHQKEIAQALEHWAMSIASLSSQTAADAVILKIGDLRRA